MGGEWVGGLEQGQEGCLCEFGFSAYCAWRIPSHLRSSQCSILLHLMDICFQQCICLWQIWQIQTCLCVVVGPGFVDITCFYDEPGQPSRVSAWTACPPKTVNRAPIAGAGGFNTICTAVCNRCDSSTACRLCRLEPFLLLHYHCSLTHSSLKW